VTALLVVVADLLLQRDGLLAGEQSPLVFAELRVQPADVVECEGLSGAVGGGLVQREGLFGVLQGKAVVAVAYVAIHPRVTTHDSGHPNTPTCQRSRNARGIR
jgi:hypothetical protein